MPDSPIIQYADQFRAALARQEAAAMQRLVEAYGLIYQRLQGNIDALLLEAEMKQLSRGQLVRLARYQSLLEQTAQELAGFQVITANEIQKAASAAIQAGANDARRLLSVAATGAPELAAQFNVLPTQTIETLLGFLSPDGPLYARLAELAGTHVDGIAKTLTEGVALGRNPAVIARQVTDAYGMPLTDSLRQVRTAQVWAYREATRATYLANADVLEGWTWHSALDADTCMSCIANHGKVFPLSETLNDHFNGRCTMIPLVKGMDNPVTETGEEWFNSQDEATQQAMMGDSKWQAWQDGKFEFSQLSREQDNAIYGMMKSETPLKDLLAELGEDSRRVVRDYGPITNTDDAVRAADEMSASQSDWERSITPGEAESIAYYTNDHGYEEINTYLRKGYTHDIPEEVAESNAEYIKRALDRASLSQDTMLYRATKEKVFSKLDVGDEFMDKGFTSTSIVEGVTHSFGTYPVKIYAPTGTKAAYISRIGDYAGEFEVMIQAGTSYRVTEKTIEGIVLEVIR